MKKMLEINRLKVFFRLAEIRAALDIELMRISESGNKARTDRMLNLVRWRTIGLRLATSIIVASGLILQQPALALDAAGEQQILFAVARQDIIAERLDATIDAIHTKLR